MRRTSEVLFNELLYVSTSGCFVWLTISGYSLGHTSPNKNLGNYLGNIGMGVKYRFVFIQLANKQGGHVLTCGARMDLTVTSNDKAGRSDK